MHLIDSRLSALQSGDSAAFEALLADYEPMLTSLSARFAGTGASLQDIRQEAALAFYRAARSYRIGSPVAFGVYARTCVRNALISRFSRQSAKTDVYSLEELQESGAFDQLVSRISSDASDRLIDIETLERLYKTADEVLSPFEREVFCMYAEGASVAEIADNLSVEKQSATNAIQRSLRKLRPLLLN